MAQTGYTPIQLYYSTTAAAVPTNTNLANGELAINITDGKLYYKDNTGTVQLLASTSGSGGTFTNLTVSGNLTLSGGTANGVTYLNGSKVLTSGSALTFDGTNLLLGNTASTGLSTGQLQVGTASVSDSAIQMLSNTTGTSGVYFGDGTTGGDRYRGAIEYANNGDILKFYSGSSAQLNLTSTSLYTASGINVGIGTSSPAYKLHAVKTGGGIVGRFDNADGVADIYGYGLEVTRSIAYIKGSGALHLGSAAGYSAVVLDSAGNLGLGVTPSAWSTSVQTALQVYTAGVSGNGGGNTASRFTHGCYLDGSTWKYQYTGVAPTRYEVTGANAGSTHSWSIAAGGTAGDAISFTQAMTLDASGNLGVGTTSPTAKLQVVGTVKISNSNADNELTFTGTDFTNVFSETSSGFQFGTTSTGYLAFFTNNTEQARITSGGQFLVGNTAGASYKVIFENSGQPILALNSTDSLGGYTAFQRNGTAYGYLGSAGPVVTGGANTDIALRSENNLLFTSGGATERFRIASNGAWGLAGANYGTAGQVLTSNGSGSAPTWQAGGGGSSQWTTSGTSIYYNTGNVGIGTASPGVKLDVSGGNIRAIANSNASVGAFASNSTSPQLLLGNASGTAHWSIYETLDASGLQGSFNIYNAGASSNYLTISTSGVVGINNTNPSADATRFVLNQSSTPSGTLPTIRLPGGWDNQGAQDNIGTYMRYGGGGVPNGTLLTARIGNNTSFVLNNCGSDNNIYGAGGRPPVYLYSGPSGSYSSYDQPPASAFSAGGSLPRMAIYSEMTTMYDGVLLTGLSIKLAGSYGGSSTRDVMCSAVQATTAFGSDRGYGTSYGYYANVSSNITANYAFYAAAGDAAKPGGGSWSSASDARVKNVLGQYARGLDDVLKINVVDFEYNGKGGHNADGRRYTGVIAQEMQEIFPEMVRTHRTKLEETDTEDTDLLMVDNSALVYALVNAIKELKADFDAYKASHP